MRASGPPELEADRKPLWKRLVWMAGIWSASVAALAAVAYGIRAWLAV